MLKGIKEIITLGSSEMMVKSHIWSLEVDRANDILYAGLHDGLIKVFLMIDNEQKCKNSYFSKQIDEFQAHKGIVYTMLLTPSKTNLFTAGLDQQIKFWDLETQKELYRLEGHTNVVYTLKLDDKKDILYSGSEDGTIRKWNLKNQKIIQVIGGLNSALSSLILKKNDVLVSVDSEKREIIRIYDSANKEFIGRFDSHKDEVFALEMTSDGKRMFSAGNDRFIKIWDCESRSLIKSILAHSKCINCLLLAKNNKFLFSCSDDCYVKIWTVYENDLVIFVAINHGCQVLTIKLSRDNQLLFSAGKSSKPVKTWDVECLQKPKTLEEVSELIRQDLRNGVIDKTGEELVKEDESIERRKGEKVKFREDNMILDKIMSSQKTNSDMRRGLLTKFENHVEFKNIKLYDDSIIIDEKEKGWTPVQKKFNVVAVESEDPVMISEDTEYFFSRKKDDKMRVELEQLAEEMENLIIQEKTDNRFKEMIVIAISNDMKDVIETQLPAMWNFLVKFTKPEKIRLSEYWQKNVKMLEIFLKIKNRKKLKKTEMDNMFRKTCFRIGKEHFLIVMKALVSNFTGSMRNVNEEIMQYDKKNRKILNEKMRRMNEAVEVVYNVNEDKGLKNGYERSQYSMVDDIIIKKNSKEKVQMGVKEKENKEGLKHKIEKTGYTTSKDIISSEECVLYGIQTEHEDFNSIEELKMMQKMLKEMKNKMGHMSNCLKNDKYREMSNNRVLKFLQKRRRVLEMREYTLQKRCLELVMNKDKDKERLMMMKKDITEREEQKQKLQDQINELNMEIRSLREECIKFKKLTEEKASKGDNPETNADGLTNKQIEELNEELKDIKSKNEKLMEENKELKDNKDADNRAGTSCFEDFIGFLKKENSSLKENYDSIKRKYEALKEENRNVLFQNKIDQFEKAKIETEKTVLKEKLELIQEKFVKLQGSIGKMQNTSGEGSHISYGGNNDLLNLSMRSNSKNLQNGIILGELLGKRENDELLRSQGNNSKITEQLENLENESKYTISPDDKKFKNLETKSKEDQTESGNIEIVKGNSNLLQINNSLENSETKEQNVVKIV